MNRFYNLFTSSLIILFLLSTLAVYAVADEEIRRVSKEEVKELIGKPGVALIDVRYYDSWEKTDTKIAGAVREHPNEIGSWAPKYDKNSTIILYCD